MQTLQVPAHAELMWILGCSASTGYLSRMTQWKVRGAIVPLQNIIGLIVERANLPYQITHQFLIKLRNRSLS